jgi:hypothetical protein
MDEPQKKPLEAVYNRKPDGRFGPGNTANPNGAPPKAERFSEAAKRMLEAREVNIEYTFPKNGKLVTSRLHLESTTTINDSLVAALIKEGMDGNVQAISELVDRVEGKPRQAVDLGGQKDNPLYVISDSDLDGELAALRSSQTVEDQGVASSQGEAAPTL